MAAALGTAPTLAPLNLKKEGLRVVKDDRHCAWGQGVERGGSAGLGQELWREQFRQLSYAEAGGAREALCRLRLLCRRWLRPEVHSKEQMLELLVLEQFLSILPAELQARVRTQRPESGDEAVAALEELEADPGRQAPDQARKPDARAQEAAPLSSVPAQEAAPLSSAPAQEAAPLSSAPAQEAAPLSSAPAQQVPPAREAAAPTEVEGEEPRAESGKLVVETDCCGVEKMPEATEAPGEDSDLERPRARAKVTAGGECSAGGVRGLQHPDAAEHQHGGRTAYPKTRAHERGHQCQECGKAFQRSSHLARHERSHRGEKPYQCGQCAKVFSQNAGLLEHLRIHTGERPFLCIHCGKSFRRSSHLNRHQRTHSREEPRRCEECGKTFSQALLLTHLQSAHRRPGSRQCAECGKAFRLSSDLLRHHRTHTGEKPFRCQRCPRAFRLNSHLAQHVRIHNEEKPFACSACGEAFRQRSGLFQHQRCRHRDRRPAEAAAPGGASAAGR